MSKCLGCGITLQDQKKEMLGYTPNLKNPYCERCFKTIHYNENIKIDNIDNDNIIKKINKLNKFTIFITDLFSLNNKVINSYSQINNPKILVLNKCDLIPNNLKLEHLEENIKKIYNLSEEVIFISAKQKMYLNYLKDLITYFKEVIFCGETSSGKSTLINNLLDTNLTTSKYQNTTLDFIKLKKDNFIIYDTPGLCFNNKISYDQIKVYIKKLVSDFILSIDNIKLSGIGNATLYLDSNIVIKSRKENINLDYVYKIEKPTDILIPGGFIFIKNKGVINSNQELELRDSIIK